MPTESSTSFESSTITRDRSQLGQLVISVGQSAGQSDHASRVFRAVTVEILSDLLRAVALLPPARP